MAGKYRLWGRLVTELRGWQQRYRVNNAAPAAFHTVDFWTQLLLFQMLA
jgi:hypothetical protein